MNEFFLLLLTRLSVKFFNWIESSTFQCISFDDLEDVCQLNDMMPSTLLCLDFFLNVYQT